MPQHFLIGPKRQLADMLNLSERRITALVTAGILPARGPQGFDLVAGVRGYIRFLKSKSRTLTDERARLTKCQADVAELNYRERQGELVERVAVSDAQFKLGRRVRDGVLNVPARVSGPCAAETDQHKIHVLLTRELTQALEGLAVV
jgi:phage terminase Nu1 subunit (DNA packaging protein)